MSKCIKQILFAIGQNCRSETTKTVRTTRTAQTAQTAQTSATSGSEPQRKLIREQFIEYIEFDSNVKR